MFRDGSDGSGGHETSAIAYEPMSASLVDLGHSNARGVPLDVTRVYVARLFECSETKRLDRDQRAVRVAQIEARLAAEKWSLARSEAEFEAAYGEMMAAKRRLEEEEERAEIEEAPSRARSMRNATRVARCASRTPRHAAAGIEEVERDGGRPGGRGRRARRGGGDPRRRFAGRRGSHGLIRARGATFRTGPHDRRTFGGNSCGSTLLASRASSSREP
jgi:hypothetical protein